jgi:hypothetical protein
MGWEDTDRTKQEQVTISKHELLHEFFNSQEKEIPHIRQQMFNLAYRVRILL